MLVERPKARSLINAIVSAHFGAKEITVLEAGGGAWSRISKAKSIRISSITTIDIDVGQLERNNYADKKIAGDLEAHKFENKYDLIEVVYVLEHVERVDVALENIMEASGDDGLIVISCPYMYSLSGMVTRCLRRTGSTFSSESMSPARRMPGRKASLPSGTYYHPLIAPRRLERFLNARGFSTELMVYFESGIYKRLGVMKMPVLAIISAVNIVTPKSYNARNGEYCMVFRNMSKA